MTTRARQSLIAGAILLLLGTIVALQWQGFATDDDDSAASDDDSAGDDDSAAH